MDIEQKNNLFLVVEVRGGIVVFSRCQGNTLKRTSHKVEFGVCILQDYWGYKMGKHLLEASLQWADTQGIKKMMLHVIETNEKAIKLYKNHGFEVEGTLKNDKLLSDGKYYDTLIMGRFNS